MNPFLSKSTLFVLMALMFVFMGATLVAGEDMVQPDGRLNQVTHFGGDAFYCVDRDFLPTQQYSDFGAGGFRLLTAAARSCGSSPRCKSRRRWPKPRNR